jgi:uncharacterized membrane protein AbrB (regulator of aidB expression)
MSYSNTKPFESREHILWEIGHCNKAATYFTILSLVFVALGAISDLLNMKLGLGPTSWLLLAIFVGAVWVIGALFHIQLARHLLGMEVIKKEGGQ